MIKKRGTIGESKKSQIWVETVLYTLIGLTIMGAILAVAVPKINQTNDKILLTQTIESMNKINEQIQDAFLYAGSQREINLMIKKGEYTIDSKNDRIQYLLKNTNLLYSQPNSSIKQGDITILTVPKPGGEKYDIYLTLNYDVNITYGSQSAEINKTFTSAPVSYSLLVINKGATTPGSQKKEINIQSVGA